jgi:hypothetical protein
MNNYFKNIIHPVLAFERNNFADRLPVNKVGELYV